MWTNDARSQWMHLKKKSGSWYYEERKLWQYWDCVKKIIDNLQRTEMWEKNDNLKKDANVRNKWQFKKQSKYEK